MAILKCLIDSHARDICGRSHRQGTCVLLDISSTDNGALLSKFTWSK